MRILYVKDVSVIREIGYFDTTGDAIAVFVLDEYAYLADDHEGLKIIDVSDPENPFEIGSVDTPGSARDVFVRDGFAYVADSTGGGLRVIGVSDPLAPVRSVSWIRPANRKAFWFRTTTHTLPTDGTGLE